ncbi:helix-turn-helix domain-containing protein [Acinetobacter baumannii]|uniref:helix-turn-helix domain-containing protein n=1 Tax=Acinetobacter baumannii TaxID=470 RepID=UPI0021F027A7|nr:helix-turn-helix domain-containing protein [Acinetobacter baumannii]MDC5198910.1 helix-turn-helix domain-containing protein [Acinetobacter baumannii]MDC5547675.1 helix-turn-helix domain-containing protein [Acinetobacter baumannii]MDO7499051.1 helix-turn-helix transcriptional regulator [Acinetobacter baumannii]CAI3120413.1 hypothetical protein MWMV9_MWMV9_03466 [Acinetobacter baumannii]
MAVTLTDFGKTLRKLRIDHDVNLKNMADSLGVTSAFLSGIETGRKAISPGLINKVSEILNLSEDESTELNAAASKTLSEVSIKVENEHDAEIAIMFARKVDDNTIDFEKLRKFLMEN